VPALTFEPSASFALASALASCSFRKVSVNRAIARISRSARSTGALRSAASSSQGMKKRDWPTLRSRRKLERNCRISLIFLPRQIARQSWSWSQWKLPGSKIGFGEMGW